MNENETTALVRAFDRAYINGKFVTPHGTQIVDLVNPTNNTVIGKVTMADEIDTRQAINLHRILGGHATLVEELGRRVGIPHRMAPLRFVRKVGRFRGNLEERRPRAGGRRTSWP